MVGRNQYPIVITRDLSKAKQWLKQQARGSERYGIVVSSQAQRLKPYARDVKSPMDPIHWFLDGKEDVRSSYYLEDVAMNFKYKVSNLIGHVLHGMPTSDILKMVGNTGPLSVIIGIV